jgi:predicted DNA-binding transcriptional regulator YafY
MARKRQGTPRPAEPSGVTAERFTRLYRLVKLLGAGTSSRETLARRLKLDVRGFYRDLELLRTAGVAVTVAGGRYSLAESAEDALTRIPFPDPHLTLGEARTLAKGRSAVHRKLAELLARLLPKTR